MCLTSGSSSYHRLYFWLSIDLFIFIFFLTDIRRITNVKVVKNDLKFLLAQHEGKFLSAKRENHFPEREKF
jgi:hypothetical protein